MGHQSRARRALVGSVCEEPPCILIRALKDEDGAVRCAAISAVADLALPGAGDLFAAALLDREPDVRFFAAIRLQALADPRAPTDPETFAYRNPDT